MAPAAMAAPEIGEATKTAAAAATTSLETGEAAAKMALACDFEARSGGLKEERSSLLFLYR